MKTKFILCFLLVTGFLISCKKEELRKDPEEILPSDYELQLLSNEPIEGQAGGFVPIEFNLLHRGVVELASTSSWNYIFDVELSDSSPGYGFISGSESYTLKLRLSPRQGISQYRLILMNYDRKILASKSIQVKANPRTDGWVFSELSKINTAVEANNNEVFLTDGYTLYKTNRELSSFMPVSRESNHYYLVSIDQQKICAFQYPGRILLSEDGGVNFSRLMVPIGKLVNAWMYGNDLITASADSCKVSKNKGVSWENFFIRDGVIKVTRLANGTYIALSKSGLNRCVNATGSPQKIDFTATITDIAVDGNIVYVLSGSELYKSSDQGNSFQKISNLESDNYQAVDVKNNRFYLRTNRGELRVTTSLSDISIAIRTKTEEGFAEMFYAPVSGNRVLCFGREAYTGFLQH